MTLVLQRLLLSAAVLICLAASVSGTTTRSNTPGKSTTTSPVRAPIEGTGTVGRATPTRSTTTAVVSLTTTLSGSTQSQSRRPTPSKSSSAITPAKLDQTPTTSKGNGGSVSSSSMRPTPTTTRSQSPSSVRPTPVTSPQNIEANSSSTSVSLRPTPPPSISSASISRRPTPSTSSHSNGVSTSFLSQPVSSPTPVVTQFSPIVQATTSFFTQPVSSPTPFMSQPQGSSSLGASSMGSSSMGSSGVSASMTTGGVSGGVTQNATGETMSTSGGPQTNATMTGGSVTSAGGSSMTSAGASSMTSAGASSVTSAGASSVTSAGGSMTSSGSTGGGSTTSSGGSSSTAQGSSSNPPVTSTTSSASQPSSGPSSTSSSAPSSSAASSGSSTMSVEMTTTGGGGGGGGQTIHVQMIFCNDYFSLYGPIDPNQRAGYTSHLQSALAGVVGAPPERIQGLFLVADPTTGRVVIQFDVVPGPGISSDQIVVLLSNRAASKSFSLSDINRSVLYMNCYDLPSPPIFPWTDYGPCPYQRCMNYGKCNVRVTGQYYCECRQPFTGKYCDGTGEKPSQPNNLLWLLTIPAAVALLSLLLCCFFCWNRQCCCFASNQPVKIVEVIDDDVYQDLDARSLRSVHSCRSCASQAPSCGAPMMTNDPGSTYYHALGRPFAVAFNDNTFSAVGYATNDMGLYSTMGARRPSLCGDEEIQVIMNGRGSCCGSDYGGYHSAGMGNKYAVAYNDRTFNTYSSMPRYDRVRNYN